MITEIERKKTEKTTEKKEKLEYFNLLLDFMFKAVFRSIEAREMVASFLCEVTGIDKELFLNAHFVGGELTKKVANERGKTADVIVKVDKNLTLIVEMNYERTKNIARKNSSYAYSTYIEKITMGDNPIYPKVILISINNYNYNKVNVPIQEFKSRDQFGNIEDGNDIIKYHLILENMLNPEYNDNIELRKMAEFLVCHTIDELNDKFEGENKYMAAVRRVEELSTDPEFIGYYDYEEAKRQDLADAKEAGRDEGLEEGMKKGIEQGIKQGISQRNQELILKMANEGLTIEMISKIIGKPQEEIEKLINN